MSRNVSTRTMSSGDINAITDIDEKNTGVKKKSFWEGKLLIHEASKPPWASLVALIDDQVVGFLFCHYEELEFGLPGTIAWVDIIGVDPGYRRQGIAAKLMEDFTASAEDVGIDRIFTLVSESDESEIGEFFISQGFVDGRMKHFRKDLPQN